MIRGFLEHEGLTVFVRSPHLPPYIAIDQADILVPAEEEAEARRAIGAFLAGAPGGDGGAEDSDKKVD